LRPDALVPFRDGMRFLQHSDDSLFHPRTLLATHPRPIDSQLASRLENRSPTIRLSTVWEIRDRGQTNPTIVDAVIARLRDRDRAVAVAAAEMLSAIGPSATTAVRQLIVGLSDQRESIRKSFVHALGVLRCEPDVVIPEIEDRLSDDDRDVACEAARALGRFGAAASGSVPRLLSKLQGSLARCSHPFSDALVDALAAITPEPKSCIQEYFGERDPELLDLALMAIDGRDPLRQAAAKTDSSRLQFESDPA
jgi:HEAT repeat protein